MHMKERKEKHIGNEPYTRQGKLNLTETTLNGPCTQCKSKYTAPPNNKCSTCIQTNIKNRRNN